MAFNFPVSGTLFEVVTRPLKMASIPPTHPRRAETRPFLNQGRRRERDARGVLLVRRERTRPRTKLEVSGLLEIPGEATHERIADCPARSGCH